jgi:TctA family transporter
MLAGFGVLGFLMRRFDFPIAPVVVGLILGPIAESQLRRALAISLGDPMTLLQSPIRDAACHRAGCATGPVCAEGVGAVQGERGLAVLTH